MDERAGGAQAVAAERGQAGLGLGGAGRRRGSSPRRSRRRRSDSPPADRVRGGTATSVTRTGCRAGRTVALSVRPTFGALEVDRRYNRARGRPRAVGIVAQRDGPRDDRAPSRRAGRRRRGARAARRPARRARALRRRLPRPARGVRRRGGGAPARAAPARRDRRARARRPAHAGHVGRRPAGRGARALPARQARPAHRLRRHGGGHRGHQPRADRLLPAEAVGPARAGALPDAGGPARATGRPTRCSRTPSRAWSGTASRPSRTTRATCSPATACRTRGSTSTATRRRRRLLDLAGVGADRLPAVFLPDGHVLERADRARAGRPARPHHAGRSSTSTTW